MCPPKSSCNNETLSLSGLRSSFTYAFIMRWWSSPDDMHSKLRVVRTRGVFCPSNTFLSPFSTLKFAGDSAILMSLVFKVLFLLMLLVHSCVYHYFSLFFKLNRRTLSLYRNQVAWYWHCNTKDTLVSINLCNLGEFLVRQKEHIKQCVRWILCGIIN